MGLCFGLLQQFHKYDNALRINLESPSSMTIRFHIFEYIQKCSNKDTHPLKYGNTHSECKKTKVRRQKKIIYQKQRLALIEKPTHDFQKYY